MFQSLSDKLSAAFKHFRNKGKLTEADVKVGMREIKLALLEADVNLKIAGDFIEAVKQECIGQYVLRSVTPGQQVIMIVHEELTELMGSENSRLEFSKTSSLL